MFEPKVQAANVAELWAMFADGSLKPVVTDVFPFSEYQSAFNCLTGRKARGKVIITMED
jgi:NADPH2:quinone reductase